MHEPTNTDLAYMAGVVDSDGYIGVHRNTYAMRVKGDASGPIYQARVQVKQTEPQAIELFEASFGGHVYQQKPSAARGKLLWTWQVHSAACRPILKALRPYLRIKVDQAGNALEVCEINASGQRRRFVVPDIIDGEPMIGLAEAARQAGKDYGTAHQCVKLGNIPFVRIPNGKKSTILVPESFIPIWRDRRRSPIRRPDITERLEACFLRSKELNRVGV